LSAAPPAVNPTTILIGLAVGYSAAEPKDGEPNKATTKAMEPSLRVIKSVSESMLNCFLFYLFENQSTLANHNCLQQSQQYLVFSNSRFTLRLIGCMARAK
jgi:hypothetical protein